MKMEAIQRNVASGLRRLSRPGHARMERYRRVIRLSARVLFIGIAVMVIWDIILASNEQQNDTWSEQARLAGTRLPFLPWFVGAIVGHVFPLRQPRYDTEATGTVMGILTALILVWSVLRQLEAGSIVSPPAMWLTAICGMLASFLLWPMKPTESGEVSG
jgi:hypothetical protein